MSRARADYCEKVRRASTPEHSRRRTVPVLAAATLSKLRIDALRWAVRANQVSFPAQIPTFGKHDRPDLQRKFAQLYFVMGWNCERIAVKYGMIHQRVRQVLSTWRRRAVETGYIQLIPPVSDPLSAAPAIRIEVATPAEGFRPFSQPEYAAASGATRV